MPCENFYSACIQCPRKCTARRSLGESGLCGETESLRLASATLHFGEEPLVTCRGGSGTLFFTGCTLKCAFCQNYQISQQGLGKEISDAEFADICLKLQDKGAENINLVTGSHHIPRIAGALELAKKRGLNIPVCWNSSAYESVETLALLKNLVDIWLPDLKTLSPSLSSKLFGASDYPDVAKKAVSWMIDNSKMRVENEKMLSGVIVRHLFLPGKLEETVETLSWLKENADKKCCISLMSQYTPVPFKEPLEQDVKRKNALSCIENRLVNTAEDADLKDLIEAFDFEYLFYQELSDDTSWLPDFTRCQPFSNKLARPVWHLSCGFID